MLDVLGQDYIRTARAKGVPGGKIIFGHALKNSLIPVVTYLGPMLAYIITGSLVVEQIFAVNGIGRAFVRSIIDRDYPLIMGTTLVLNAANSLIKKLESLCAKNAARAEQLASYIYKLCLLSLQKLAPAQMQEFLTESYTLLAEIAR